MAVAAAWWRQWQVGNAGGGGGGGSGVVAVAVGHGGQDDLILSAK